MTSAERIKKALSLASDTKVFELGEGYLSKVPEVFNKCFPGRKAVVVTDPITWGIAGEKTFYYLVGAGIPTEQFLITDKGFHADWKYVEMIDGVLEKTGGVAIAVGAGVINDLCKFCSSRHNQSYICIPTAASVDGYSSFGASITVDGKKQTFSCPAPMAIVADVTVLAGAPKHMTAAGYADLAAKVPAGGEWMIADLFGTEPIHEVAWSVLLSILDELLDDPEGIAEAKPSAVSALFEGLTLSGIAMQIARDTRPASCSDHLFNHYLDMSGHTFNGRPQPHGFQVAIGTLTMCAFFDELLKLDLTQIDIDKCVAAWPTLEQEQENARRIFSDFVDPELGYTQITRKYQGPEEVRRELTLVKEQWPELKEKFRAQVYPFEKMQAMFKAAGAPYTPEQIGLSREKLRDIVDYVQYFRWRINLFDLAKRAGVYELLKDKVFGKGGAWEIA